MITLIRKILIILIANVKFRRVYRIWQRFVAKIIKLQKTFYFEELSKKDKFIFAYLWEKEIFKLLSVYWKDKKNFILYRIKFSSFLYTLFTPKIKKEINSAYYGIDLRYIFLSKKIQYWAKSNFRNTIFYKFLNSGYYLIDLYDWCLFFKKHFSYLYGYLLDSLSDIEFPNALKHNNVIIINTLVFFPLNNFKVTQINAPLVKKSLAIKKKTSINRILWAKKFDFKDYLKKMREKQKDLLKQTITKYAYLYRAFNKKNLFSVNSKSFIKYTMDKLTNGNLIFLASEFKDKQKKKYSIRFTESTVIKNYDLLFLQKIRLLFIRKSKIFNKGRFSRNRQLYRTGFYWCLWINIIIVYALYLYFYRFSFNFGFLWILMGGFCFCFFFSRGFQNKFFEVSGILTEVYANLKWFEVLIELLFRSITAFNIFVKKQFTHLIINKLKKDKELIVEFWSWVYRCIVWCSLEWAKKKRKRFVYVWKFYPGIDKSFLKWRSKVFWLMQLWEMLTTY